MSKIIDSRQYPLVALAQVHGTNGPTAAPNALEIKLPPGALLRSIAVLTAVAFTGTSPTLTAGDGTTTFASGVDIATTGAETTTGTPKFYPAGGTITITTAGVGMNAGHALVSAEYVVIDRDNETYG